MSNPDTGDADYRLKAKAYWDFLVTRLTFVCQIQADYGKWLIVTIASTHLAAIYLISQPHIPEVVRRDPATYWPFIIGLCLILVCGLATWANYTLVSNMYGGWMRPAMLTDPAGWPTNVSIMHRRWVVASFWTPIIIGLAAALCIPWGGYRIFYYPHPAIVQSPTINPSPPPLPNVTPPKPKPIMPSPKAAPPSPTSPEPAEPHAKGGLNPGAK